MCLVYLLVYVMIIVFYCFYMNLWIGLKVRNNFEWSFFIVRCVVNIMCLWKEKILLVVSGIMMFRIVK